MADFGVAKARHGATNTELTPLGFALGPPAYVTPTQAVGKEIRPSADVYALGRVARGLQPDLPPFAGRTAPSLG